MAAGTWKRRADAPPSTQMGGRAVSESPGFGRRRRRNRTAEGTATRAHSTGLRLAGFLAPLVNGELFVNPGDHLVNARFLESLEADGVRLLKLLKASLKVAQLLFRLCVLHAGPDHSSISTSPFRRPSASRVLPKSSIQSSQSRKSSAAKISSGPRVRSMASSYSAASRPVETCVSKSSASSTTASTSCGSSFAVTKLPSTRKRTAGYSAQGQANGGALGSDDGGAEWTTRSETRLPIPWRGEVRRASNHLRGIPGSFHQGLPEVALAKGILAA